MSKVKIEGNASGTGTLTIAAPNTNTDRTFNLPDEDGTVLTKTSGEDVSFYDATGTTPKFFWDASAESLGIANSNTNYQLTSGEKRLRVGDGSEHATIDIYSGATKWGALTFSDSATNSSFVGQIGYYHPDNYMVFNTNGSERMRIDSSGNIFINDTTMPSSGGTGILVNRGNSTGGRLDFGKTYSGGFYANRYFYNGTTVGSIIYADTSTNFNTTSDYRLKTDVQPMTGATERLKALKPVNFEWIADGTRVDGFLAHEAQEVVPEAVTGTKDAMTTESYEVTPAVLDDDGNVVTEAVMGEREVPDYQGIDQSKLVPLLVATIQELEARIAALESV